MTAEQLISFARGAPSLDIIDVAGLKAAAVRALDSDPGGLTAYGPASGYAPLRAWIAAQHGVDVDRVLVTNGSLQADAFTFDHVVSPGDDVVVERPTYDRTLLNLRTLGAKIHPITVDADGLDVDELQSLVDSGVRPRLIHVIPNYQNPAGVTLSLSRRHRLLELARTYGITVFEDDPYARVRFRGEPPPSLLSLDDAGVVLHASSFTKTVCPGVRVGYLIGPATAIATITARALTTYISPNMFAQGTVYQFCASGDIDRSVETVGAALADRAARLGAALRAHIPGCRFHSPDGGYFLWVEFPDGVDTDRLAAAATARGVAVVRGSDFVLDGGRTSLRLAFCAVGGDVIDEGVRRLAAALGDVA
jgi:DNA-binding transcriptional MocR family regulator